MQSWDASQYLRFAPLSRRVILWETNYIQVMDGIDAIVAWLHGTGLRPFLARRDAAEQPVFLDRYAALLAEAFPPRADGKVLLPYPRLFFIAAPYLSVVIARSAATKQSRAAGAG